MRTSRVNVFRRGDGARRPLQPPDVSRVHGPVVRRSGTITSGFLARSGARPLDGEGGPMNRRGVLKGIGASAAAALWPRKALAGPASDVESGVGLITAAVARARAGAKSLLLVVAREGDRNKYDRAEALNTWLRFGDDQDVAALA